MVYSTEMRRMKRRKTVDLPAQTELKFSQMADGEMSKRLNKKLRVLSYELSPTYLLLTRNACREMPVSWREHHKRHGL